VIPSPFDYLRPRTVEETVQYLDEAGEDAALLAGGQSLVPALRCRDAVPAVVVDLSEVEELRGIRVEDDQIVVGAMTTLRRLATDPIIAEHAPLLATAARLAGDRRTRTMATLGGSLALADPAADLPTAAVALDATLLLAGPEGRRTTSARSFFVEPYTTALGLADVLVEMRFPTRFGWGAHYTKVCRTTPGWAVVGVAALLRQEDGVVTDARVVFTNMGPVPVRSRPAEEALLGARLTDAIVGAAADAGADESEPVDDAAATAPYRRQLARTLTRRAVRAAAGR
jgi:carbon-monoxide dehydrogenase medium subunit